MESQSILWPTLMLILLQVSSVRQRCTVLRHFLAICSAKRQKLELQVHATDTECAALNSHNERIAAEIASLRVLVRDVALAVSLSITRHI